MSCRCAVWKQTVPRITQPGAVSSWSALGRANRLITQWRQDEMQKWQKWMTKWRTLGEERRPRWADNRPLYWEKGREIKIQQQAALYWDRWRGIDAYVIARHEALQNGVRWGHVKVTSKHVGWDEVFADVDHSACNCIRKEGIGGVGMALFWQAHEADLLLI